MPADETITRMVRHFETIEREHMRGLPIVNPELVVEALGFRDFGAHAIGVLISPWFMNLVLIPGNDEFSGVDQGTVVDIRMPAGPCAFTVSHDAELGTYLSAVLFGVVTDFPDQAAARDIGTDALERCFTEIPAPTPRMIGRRQLLTGLGKG